MNEADSRHLAACLEGLGFSAVSRADDARVAVLNTCVVRQQPEDKAYTRLTHLGGLKKRRPELIIAVMGCLVGVKDPVELKERFPFVDVFLPPSEPKGLLDLLEERGVIEQNAADERERLFDEMEWDLPAAHSGVSAFVPAVLGCSFACTYCIIPYRRGRERIRLPEDILEDAGRLVGKGVKEISLLGQIIDRYGLDLEPRVALADVLEQLAGLPGLKRIRFLTSHPNWMTAHLFEVVAAHEPICPCFEIALQSGSNEVLKRMKRGYSAEQFSELVARARSCVPDTAINTDIIVGFPGETEAQFQETLELVRELRFDMVHIAKYSPRPQTYSARNYPDDVPAEVKEERRLALEAVQQEVQTKINETLLNQTVSVLVEDQRKGRWFGRTPQNKLVFFDDEADRLGQVLDLHIDWTGPYSMIGHPEKKYE